MNKSAFVLASTVALGGLGCGSPTHPAHDPLPSPSASPAFPRGIPQATALDNLPLIESLERGRGRPTTRLVWVSTDVDLGGRVAGAAWRYQFAETVGDRFNLFEWTVDTDGTVRYLGPAEDFHRLPFADLRPLTIDSPEMVRLGLQHGAQRLLDRHPDANVAVSMIYRYFDGEPACNVVFRPNPSVGCVPVLYIHARTGALMASDLSCLDR